MTQQSDGAGIIKRLGKWAGVLLIIAAVVVALSPFWIRYWDRYNPFSNVQEKPKVTIITPEAQTKALDFPKNLEPDTGILEIPKLGLKFDLVYGIGEEDLAKAPGFYPQSGWPDNGNVSIAGHRNTAGSPFMDLDKLAKGDKLTLVYRQNLYTYEVDSVFVTNDRDWSVIDPTPQPALTLTTCTPAIRPPDGHYDRLIVRAYLKNKNPL